jgi:hypothetical protein
VAGGFGRHHFGRDRGFGAYAYDSCWPDYPYPRRLNYFYDC